MRSRQSVDLAAYVERTRSGPCFICSFLRGDSDYAHHLLYRDDFCAAVLARFPSQDGRYLVKAIGYTLVVPVEHREHAVADFTPEEYLRLQTVVYRVAAALRQELPTERTYVLALGSAQGNSHVHWHVVSLPPGVPYEEQQFYFLMAEHGMLEVLPEAMDDLASRLRRRLGP